MRSRALALVEHARRKADERGIILEFRSSTLINTNEERKNRTKAEEDEWNFQLPFLSSLLSDECHYVHLD